MATPLSNDELSAVWDSTALPAHSSTPAVAPVTVPTTPAGRVPRGPSPDFPPASPGTPTVSFHPREPDSHARSPTVAPTTTPEAPLHAHPTEPTLRQPGLGDAPDSPNHVPPAHNDSPSFVVQFLSRDDVHAIKLQVPPLDATDWPSAEIFFQQLETALQLTAAEHFKKARAAGDPAATAASVGSCSIRSSTALGVLRTLLPPSLLPLVQGETEYQPALCALKDHLLPSAAARPTLARQRFLNLQPYPDEPVTDFARRFAAAARCADLDPDAELRQFASALHSRQPTRSTLARSLIAQSALTHLPLRLLDLARTLAETDTQPPSNNEYRRDPTRFRPERDNARSAQRPTNLSPCVLHPHANHTSADCRDLKRLCDNYHRQPYRANDSSRRDRVGADARASSRPRQPPAPRSPAPSASPRDDSLN